MILRATIEILYLSTPPRPTMPKTPTKNAARLRARLYTDGSHIKGTPRRGWGAVLEYRGRLYELSGVADPASDPAAASNPTMELRAAAAALERLRQVRPAEMCDVLLLADYTGVREYGRGAWRPERAKVAHFRTEALRLHAAAKALRGDGVRLEFEHVRGHSGVEGNEMADRLARGGRTLDTFGDLERGNSL